eukprot:TRINITY_DN3886_c0_g1_i8.p1 TRINITY_DN3886_c0_g1~~TRINITY_DN3886_c0_g1_i8.p1  ORF type:complete len:1050 (-),score=368.86 TRINITY_DN3886_c0_g1_i8:229-2979(-)
MFNPNQRGPVQEQPQNHMVNANQNTSFESVPLFSPTSNSQQQQQHSGGVMFNPNGVQNQPQQPVPMFNPQPQQTVSQPQTQQHQQPLQTQASKQSQPTRTYSKDGRPLHAIFAFGFGGRIVSIPDPDVHGYDIHLPTMDSVTGHMANNQSLKAFPGPLISSRSRAADVNTFMHRKISGQMHEDAFSTSNVFSSSNRMLWQVMQLIFNNSGLPFNEDGTLPDNTLQGILLDGANNQAVGFVNSHAGSSAPPTHKDSGQYDQPSPVDAIARIEALMLKGERLQACQVAVETAQWSHALLISSHLNLETFSWVISQFSEASCNHGSPLHTLYSMFGQQQGNLVDTSVQEYLSIHQQTNTNASNAGWQNMTTGNTKPQSFTLLDRWQESLAMMLTNRTQNDQDTIKRLGHALWEHVGDVFAAHICYLIAGEDAGIIGVPGSLIVSVGGDHIFNMRQFMSPENLQRTEIWECAYRQGNPQYVRPQSQVLKYIYAMQLAEIGQCQRAIEYVTSIIEVVNETSRQFAYNLVFLNKLQDLEEALKVHLGMDSQATGTKSLLGGVLSAVDRGVVSWFGGDGNESNANDTQNTYYRSNYRIDSQEQQSYHHQPQQVPMYQQPQQVNQWNQPQQVHNQWNQPQQINQWNHQPQENQWNQQQQQQQQQMQLEEERRRREELERAEEEERRMAEQQRKEAEERAARQKEEEERKRKEQEEANKKSETGGGGGSGGWFGWLTGGSGDKSKDEAGEPKKKHNANLGKKNAFYFDEKLGKWVREGQQAKSNEDDDSADGPPASGGPPVASGGNGNGMPPSGGGNQYSAFSGGKRTPRYVSSFDNGNGNEGGQQQQQQQQPYVMPGLPQPGVGGGGQFFMPQGQSGGDGGGGGGQGGAGDGGGGQQFQPMFQPQFQQVQQTQQRRNLNQRYPQ